MESAICNLSHNLTDCILLASLVCTHCVFITLLNYKRCIVFNLLKLHYKVFFLKPFLLILLSQHCLFIRPVKNKTLLFADHQSVTPYNGCHGWVVNRLNQDNCWGFESVTELASWSADCVCLGLQVLPLLSCCCLILWGLFDFDRRACLWRFLWCRFSSNHFPSHRILTSALASCLPAV